MPDQPFIEPRRRAAAIPLLGEIFSLTQSGNPSLPGVTDTGGGDGGGPEGDVHGIQTQEGQDIDTQGGGVIQAQNQ